MGHEGLEECAIAVIIVCDADIVGHFVLLVSAKDEVCED